MLLHHAAKSRPTPKTPCHCYLFAALQLYLVNKLFKMWPRGLCWWASSVLQQRMQEKFLYFVSTGELDFPDSFSLSNILRSSHDTQGVQSFCQEGHMWRDEHLGDSSIVVVWLRAVFHSFYESSHAGRSKFDQGLHLARRPDFGHACTTQFLSR